jgi:hypothetical protein
MSPPLLAPCPTCMVTKTRRRKPLVARRRRHTQGRDAASSDTAQAYNFEGCGAHSSYITPADDGSGVDELGRSDTGFKPYDDQIGGYPFRWCFTIGGTKCNELRTHSTNVLREATRWKQCSGHYNCGASITGPIPATAAELSRHDLSTNETSFFETGLSREWDSDTDWSQCCELCGETVGCAQWSFDMDSICIFYSDVTAPESRTNVSYLTGMPGHDDPPMACLERNYYDTCTTGPECPAANSTPSDHSASWCPAGHHRCFVEVWVATFDSFYELQCVSDVDRCRLCDEDECYHFTESLCAGPVVVLVCAGLGFWLYCCAVHAQDDLG